MEQEELDGSCAWSSPDGKSRAVLSAAQNAEKSSQPIRSDNRGPGEGSGDAHGEGSEMGRKGPAQITDTPRNAVAKQVLWESLSLRTGAKLPPRSRTLSAVAAGVLPCRGRAGNATAHRPPDVYRAGARGDAEHPTGHEVVSPPLPSRDRYHPGHGPPGLSRRDRVAPAQPWLDADTTDALPRVLRHRGDQQLRELSRKQSCRAAFSAAATPADRTCSLLLDVALFNIPQSQK